jgi:hypothetical protein
MKGFGCRRSAAAQGRPSSLDEVLNLSPEAYLNSARLRDLVHRNKDQK